MKNFTEENIKATLLLSGIYKLEINKKFYIGSSVSIGHRLKNHRWSLISKKHHNRTLQNLFNKYGIENMLFEVVEECIPDLLIERESFYISSLNPYINHILDPQKIIRDVVYKKRLSEGAKESFRKGRQIHNQKKTYQYTVSGIFIKEFKNATEAALEVLGKNDPSSICSVCNNLGYSSGGYRWSYLKLDKLEDFKKKYKEEIIEQCNIDGSFIKEWSSITTATEMLKVSNIARALKYPSRTAGGYKWRYKSQSALNSVNSGKVLMDNPEPSLASNSFEGATTNTYCPTGTMK